MTLNDNVCHTSLKRNILVEYLFKECLEGSCNK